MPRPGPRLARFSDHMRRIFQRSANMVAAMLSAGIGQQFVVQIAPAGPVPQIVVRVDDGQIWPEDCPVRHRASPGGRESRRIDGRFGLVKWPRQHSTATSPGSSCAPAIRGALAICPARPRSGTRMPPARWMPARGWPLAFFPPIASVALVAKQDFAGDVSHCPPAGQTVASSKQRQVCRTIPFYESPISGL